MTAREEGPHSHLHKLHGDHCQEVELLRERFARAHDTEMTALRVGEALPHRLELEGVVPDVRANVDGGGEAGVLEGALGAAVQDDVGQGPFAAVPRHTEGVEEVRGGDGEDDVRLQAVLRGRGVEAVLRVDQLGQQREGRGGGLAVHVPRGAAQVLQRRGGAGDAFNDLCNGGGGTPPRPSRCAGGYFRVYALRGGCHKGSVAFHWAPEGNVCPAHAPAHAPRATFVLSILSPAPSLSSPREVPQIDRTRPQTFSARHLA